MNIELRSSECTPNFISQIEYEQEHDSLEMALNGAKKLVQSYRIGCVKIRKII